MENSWEDYNTAPKLLTPTSKKLTKTEILDHAVWDEFVFEMQMYSSFFDKKITVQFFTKDEQEHLSDKMVDSLNDFLNLTETDRNTIKEFLWKDCQDSFEDTDYGAEEGQTNYDYFNIHNLEDAHKKSFINRVQIFEEGLKNRYAFVLFYPEWEQEHGCGIVLQNGIPIDTQQHDPRFKQYEN